MTQRTNQICNLFSDECNDPNATFEKGQLLLSTFDAVPLQLPNDVIVNNDSSSDDEDDFSNDSSHDNESIDDDFDEEFWRQMDLWQQMDVWQQMECMALHNEESSESSSQSTIDGIPITLHRAIVQCASVEEVQSLLEENSHLCGDSIKKLIELAFLFHHEQPERCSVMRLLIEHDPECARTWDEDGMFLFRKALSYYWKVPLDIIQLLLEMNPDALYATDAEGMLSIQGVLSNASVPLNVIEFLIGKEPNIVRAQDSRGNFPLHLACKNYASLEVIRFLVEKERAILREPDNDGRLPIHHTYLVCVGILRL